MDRFEIVICCCCGMDTCEVSEESGDIESSCGMCGFYEDPIMKNTPTKEEINYAINFANLFKEWAEMREIEDPSAYAIMKSREDGISMWMNLESLSPSYNYAKYSGLDNVESLEKESGKIFRYFYNDSIDDGSLSITKKMEVGKEGIDLIEYIIG